MGKDLASLRAVAERRELEMESVAVSSSSATPRETDGFNADSATSGCNGNRRRLPIDDNADNSDCAERNIKKERISLSMEDGGEKDEHEMNDDKENSNTITNSSHNNDNHSSVKSMKCDPLSFDDHSGTDMFIACHVNDIMGKDEHQQPSIRELGDYDKQSCKKKVNEKLQSEATLEITVERMQSIVARNQKLEKEIECERKKNEKWANLLYGIKASFKSAQYENRRLIEKLERLQIIARDTQQQQGSEEVDHGLEEELAYEKKKNEELRLHVDFIEKSLRAVKAEKTELLAEAKSVASYAKWKYNEVKNSESLLGAENKRLKHQIQELQVQQERDRARLSVYDMDLDQFEQVTEGMYL